MHRTKCDIVQHLLLSYELLNALSPTAALMIPKMDNHNPTMNLVNRTSTWIPEMIDAANCNISVIMLITNIAQHRRLEFFHFLIVLASVSAKICDEPVTAGVEP